MAVAAALLGTYDIDDALVLCGTDADNNYLIWNDTTTSQQIVSDVFNDNFNNTFMDITYKELDDNWKTHIQLFA